MGKIKNRRSKSSRYNPLSTSQINDIATSSPPELLIHQDEHVNINGLNNIIEKLSSQSIEEKITALNTLAALALDKESSEHIVNQNLVFSVAPLLSSKSTQVRLASAGALRNICIAASDDVLEGIIAQDIMQPLVKLLKEYSSIISPVETKKCDSHLKKAIANATDDSIPLHLIFIQAVHILWNLCEGNECALSIFNQEDLVSILLKHIDMNVWGYSLSLPIAECLLCVSENNENATSAILQNPDTLLAMLSHASMNKDNPMWIQYVVVLSGIMVNVNYCSPGGANLRITLDILSMSLEQDISSYISLIANAELPRDHSNGHSRTMEELECILSSQQLSLEILSNLCCLGDDDDEDYIDCEEGSDGESAEEDPEAMDTSTDFASDSPIPSEIIEALKYYQFVEKIRKKYQVPLDSFSNMKVENESQQSIIEKLFQIRIRAIQCFQNLTFCLDIEELGGSKVLYDTWLSFGFWLCSDSKSDAFLHEAVSGAMRVIIDKLRQGECQQLLNVTPEDLKQIFQAGLKCSLGSVRANLARMVGNLGCLLIEKNQENDVIQRNVVAVLSSSTEYLLQVANNDDELFVRAEALDVIIDLFSDDKTDKLAAQIHLVENLKGIQPHFKAKYQKMKKKLGDHRPLVLTVKDNLSAFIKYKSSRVSKY